MSGDPKDVVIDQSKLAGAESPDAIPMQGIPAGTPGSLITMCCESALLGRGLYSERSSPKWESEDAALPPETGSGNKEE